MDEQELKLAPAEETNFKKVRGHVKKWLTLHKGESFDLDMICRQLEISEREHRHYVVQALWYEVQAKSLEKSNRIYSVRDNTIKTIDWVNASLEDTLKVEFPYGIEDNTQFGFAENIVISPGDLIVIAGQSNAGKTCFCHNLLWLNMDSFPCTLMGNEYSAGKFRRRVSRMVWKDPLKEDGNPKFELIDRRDRWQDIIRPDNINIIDWINLGDNFYQIGMILDNIQSKLHRGIAIVSLQKSGEKQHGLGGAFSEHLASLYLSMDFNRLTVLKAKEWHDHNPNKRVYGFEIVNAGTQFHNIRPIKKCPRCAGSGFIKGGYCDECLGTGWIDE